MIKKKKTGKKLLSFLLTLSMVMSLMSGMCLTALASGDKTYRDFLNTTTVVKFDGKEWYLTKQSPNLEDQGSVTLLSKEIVGLTQFCAEEVYTNNIYEGSAVQRAVNNFYNEKISAEAKEASSVFVLSKEQAKEIEVANSNVLKCQKYNNREDSWWLCSPGMNWARAACVFGSSGHVNEDGAWVKSEWENLGVRPSLRLDLSKVNFSYVELKGDENMSPSGGETTQAFFSLKSSGSSQNTMTDVVYTAKDGYYFPLDYSVSPVNGITVTRISDNQIKVSGTLTDGVAKITLTAPTAKPKPAAPTSVTATDCTAPNVNDGMLNGVTEAMEYKKSDATDWIAVTGSAITGLAPGTYYVRTKATGSSDASFNKELVVKGFVEYTVLFRVLYGAWDDGSTEDKTVTLTGREGGNLTLTADQIPKVGGEPDVNYMEGIWLVTPSTDTPITDWTGYVYLYLPSEMAVVADDPTPNTLNYTGFAQNLVTAGSVSGGTMMYALGTETEATEPYTTSIPKATEVGTYYVWYGVKGDESHIDTAPKCIQVTIGERKPIPIPTPTPTPTPDPEPTPDPDPEPEPTPAPEPQDPDEYTDPDSGEVIPELVEVPETDEAGTVIEKQSDGSVTVTDDELGTAGQISPAVFAEGQVYRLYNPNTGEHFYTKNPEERDALSSMGWNYESEQTTKTIASSEEGAAPVYRVYNPYTGLHHYTCDKSEALWLKDMGWNYEGISMYAYEKGSGYGTPTYRLYAPFPDAHGQYQHIFTVHEDERIALLMAGYSDEGVAWNVK